MHNDDNDKDFTLSVSLHAELDKGAPIKRKIGLSNFQVVSGASSRPINGSPSRIFWHSFRETTGTTRAIYEITDGLDGPVLMTVSLAAGESTRDYFGKCGLSVLQSIYFKLVSGSVVGNIGAMLEEDYQASNDQVEVMNFPGYPDKVDTPNE